MPTPSMDKRSVKKTPSKKASSSMIEVIVPERLEFISLEEDSKPKEEIITLNTEQEIIPSITEQDIMVQETPSKQRDERSLKPILDKLVNFEEEKEMQIYIEQSKKVMIGLAVVIIARKLLYSIFSKN
jgi:hypothetical protein